MQYNARTNKPPPTTTKVREVNQLSHAEGTTASDLRAKLRSVAEEFVVPGSATEVNVRGSARQDVLCSIQAALDAASGSSSSGDEGGRRSRGRGDSPWAWALAISATEALVGLASEVHTMIFDGMWPRFLISDEFTVMMSTTVRMYLQQHCVCTCMYEGGRLEESLGKGKGRWLCFVPRVCTAAVHVCL